MKNTFKILLLLISICLLTACKDNKNDDKEESKEEIKEENYSNLSDKTQERIRDLSQQIVELEQQKTNVLKEQQRYYNEINANANEEKVLIDQQLHSLGAQIKALREKEKAGNITAEESDELVFKKLKNDYTACLNKPFSRRQINKLKRIYSSHVIHKYV